MEQITIDLIPNGKMPMLHASQYDDGRQVRINLTENRQAYTLTGNEVLSLAVRKADNTLVTMDIANVYGGKSYVEFATTEQMCAVAGLNFGELTITNNGTKVGSLNFYLACEPSPEAGGLRSRSEINNLKRQVHDAVVEELKDNGASETGYDNTESGLEATNVQEAIDEVNTKIENIPSVDAYTKEQSDEKYATKTELSAKADASEVDSALALKADKSTVTAISNKVSELDADVYGGFVPDYQSGDYTENNGKAVYNSGDAWVYVVLDVTYFVGKTLTISTYADRPRKILFTDSSNNIIDTVTIDTGNPNLYSTVEATVPTGATKCYIDKYASGQNDIVVAGYYQLKLALKTEVPMVEDEFGDNNNATLSQKFITDNFGNSIEAVITGGNTKIPIIDEDVPIYLDNLFRGISPKEAKCIESSNINACVYDKTVLTLPHASGVGTSTRVKMHLVDDYKFERHADVPFNLIAERTGSKKVLFIGDSMTQNLSYLTPLKILSDNGDYNITFLGTLGDSIKNEGRQGWAAYTYCNLPSYSGLSNAFWDGSKFNFAYYMTQSGIDVPDYIFINLGTNDAIRGIMNPNDDDEVRTVVTTNYETMINSIHSYNANIPLVLWLPPTRSLAGRNNHIAIDNALRINKFLIEKFDKNAYINAKVYLMHTYLFVNPYTDYTMTNVTINGVTYQDCDEPIHPTQVGGEKIAKGILREMMYVDGLLS